MLAENCIAADNVDVGETSEMDDINNICEEDKDKAEAKKEIVQQEKKGEDNPAMEMDEQVI